MKEPLERLVVPGHPAAIVEELVEEPRVEQVKHGVLGAADILVDVHPILRALARPRRVLAVRDRGSVSSTTRTQKTCPSCRSRASPVRRTSGSVSRRTRESKRAAILRPRTADRAAAAPGVRRREPAPRRSVRSRRLESAFPSNAAARSASRAACSGRSFFRFRARSGARPMPQRAAALDMPLKSSLATRRPSSTYAVLLRRGTRPCLVAKSKSRSSCAGTPITAPLPYSAST